LIFFEPAGRESPRIAVDRWNGNDLAARYASALQRHPSNQRLFMNLKEHID